MEEGRKTGGINICGTVVRCPHFRKSGSNSRFLIPASLQHSMVESTICTGSLRDMDYGGYPKQTTVSLSVGRTVAIVDSLYSREREREREHS